LIIYVDIDGTLCTHENDYGDAKPIYTNINYINKLYDYGHTIIIWTARGTGTGKDWRYATKQQLKQWGVKYHKLKFGKPVYDLLICDKVLNIGDINEFRW
jgi:CMP-N,N'-diacetyllegionaminic acid synthase